MDSFIKNFKDISASIMPKSNKTRKLRVSKKSKTSKKSNSSSRHRSSNSTSPTRKFKRTLSKVRGNLINVDDLAKQVDTLHTTSKQVFKKKKKSSPNSPIILTVKNLDTGKATNATVIKDLNTGKYELYKLSGSK
jgi:hypothetical protein